MVNICLLIFLLFQANYSHLNNKYDTASPDLAKTSICGPSAQSREQVNGFEKQGYFRPEPAGSVPVGSNSRGADDFRGRPLWVPAAVNNDRLRWISLHDIHPGKTINYAKAPAPCSSNSHRQRYSFTATASNCSPREQRYSFGVWPKWRLNTAYIYCSDG